jgi:lipopolysaccharide export LptBFGC system permease protein LptF
MLWTLQSYIFRELGKTFVLTAAGLTTIVALGGGVANIIGFGEVTPELFLKIMALVLPMAAAFTLPMAALFSATATYGRLSADNEITACRASGINIHRLLAPCVLISAFSAAITFASVSYIIPGLFRNLNELARADLLRLVQHGLKKPSRLGFWNNRYRIYADRIDELRIPPELTAAGMTGAMRLSGAAFLKLGADEWELFGFTDRVDIMLSSEADRPVISATMSGGSAYDRRAIGWRDIGSLQVGRLEIPREIPRKVKWLNLPDLLYHRRHPEELQEIRAGAARVRGLVAESLFYQWAGREFSHQRPIELFGESVSYRLRAREMSADPDDGRPIFSGVTVEEQRPRRPRTLQAGHATLEFERQEGGLGSVAINMYDDVTMADPAEPARRITKRRDRLDPVPLPAEVQAAANRLSLAELTDRTAPPAPGRTVAKGVEKLRGELAKTAREITGVLHQRLALAASVLVLVILSAALSIIWRGAHVLVAFGISFVPAMFVVATIIAGKQLANNPGTALVGIVMMWAAIAVVAGLDVLVLTRILRR